MRLLDAHPETKPSLAVLRTPSIVGIGAKRSVGSNGLRVAKIERRELRISFPLSRARPAFIEAGADLV